MQYKRIDTRTLKIWPVDTGFQQAQRVVESINAKKSAHTKLISHYMVHTQNIRAYVLHSYFDFNVDLQ